MSKVVLPGPPTGFLIFWAIALAWAVGAWMLFIWLLSRQLPRRRQSDAAGRSGILIRATAGGRAGMINYTIPFVRFELDEDGIVFRFPFSVASATWNDISRATLIQPVVPVGKGVEFRVPGHPTLTLWSDDSTCRQVLEICRQHGVDVSLKLGLRV